MGIKDITLSENIHTITAAIENKKENFDTENKMREDLLKKIRDLVQETPAEDDDEEAGAYVKIRNDIDDLLDTVGMNYYIRGHSNGRETLYAAFWWKGYNGGNVAHCFFCKRKCSTLTKSGYLWFDENSDILMVKKDREERSFYYEYRKNHKIPGEKPV